VWLWWTRGHNASPFHIVLKPNSLSFIAEYDQYELSKCLSLVRCPCSCALSVRCDGDFNHTHPTTYSNLLLFRGAHWMICKPIFYMKCFTPSNRHTAFTALFCLWAESCWVITMTYTTFYFHKLTLLKLGWG
jgi:hypothetical protein